MNSLMMSDCVPVSGFPNYVISNYALVFRVRKDGSRELLIPFRDKKDKRRWVYVNLWRNRRFFKIPIRQIIRESWGPVLKKREQSSDKVEQPVSDIIFDPTLSKKRTTDPMMQSLKFKQMIDGYNPDLMSISSYMRYLRKQGYRFTTSHLSAALSIKKQKHIKQLN